MSLPALAISGSGMVSGVGLNAPASCAAIRAALDNFQETRFMDRGGEWILGCTVPLEQPWRGRTRLVKMLAMALAECLGSGPGLEPAKTPLMLCLAETKRPGRLEGIDNELFLETERELGVRFHDKSRIIAQGRVSAAVALHHARQLMAGGDIEKIIVAGVDSLLTGPTLAAYEEHERLLTSQNSNGFIPGEAAAAILVEAARPTSQPQLICTGIGFGIEKATIDSEEPLRADGLVQAFRSALADAGTDMGQMDFRITDLSGEQYGFKEASLALSRTLRKRKEEFDIWHPADCIGEVGAAIGPVLLAVADASARKGHTPGNNILCHLGSDEGKRVAMVLRYQPGRAA